MKLKGNKGELSELYAFLKLLGDGRMYSGDKFLNTFENRYYPIVKVFRDDAKDRNSYSVNEVHNTIDISGPGVYISIHQDSFKREAKSLLEIIRKERKKPQVEIDSLESFLDQIKLKSIKAKSSDKADIRIVIHNLDQGIKPELGYSIKSKLGANSTLINSNVNRTNFVYRVDGINDEQMDHFNTFTKKFKQKFSYLSEIGAKVSFSEVADHVMRENLLMLDLGMPVLIGEAILAYYSGHSRKLSDVLSFLVNTNPLNFGEERKKTIYEYKIKQFLLAFALGMTASTPWSGDFNAGGGFIIVKEDGDIACYHFFDRNELESYLFCNTAFETPSTNRHKYGYIEKEEGLYYLKLNLQIRFI